MKTQLRRVKHNKGQTDNGHEYDYTRIYVDIPVYGRSKKEFGVAELELEFGTEAEAEKLVHLRDKLPVMVDVDWVPAKKKAKIRFIS